LLTIAQGLGYDVFEQPISRDMLYTADEVFVCGTAAEVVALNEIDFRKINKGKIGQITRELQKVYSEVVHGEYSQYGSWLSYIVDSEVLVSLPQFTSVSAD
jgi:branched-chain amino acid aminotransferase